MSLLLDKTYEIGEETIYNYASSKTKKNKLCSPHSLVDQSRKVFVCKIVLYCNVCI